MLFRFWASRRNSASVSNFDVGLFFSYCLYLFIPCTAAMGGKNPGGPPDPGFVSGSGSQVVLEKSRRPPRFSEMGWDKLGLVGENRGIVKSQDYPDFSWIPRFSPTFFGPSMSEISSDFSLNCRGVLGPRLASLTHKFRHYVNSSPTTGFMTTRPRQLIPLVLQYGNSSPWQLAPRQIVDTLFWLPQAWVWISAPFYQRTSIDN